MTPVVPGEVLVGPGTVELNPGRPRVALTVSNDGDRPVQVGSHFHFALVNGALSFDRAAAWGHRLDVPAGTAVRFEPGVERDIVLVPLAGARVVPGLQVGYPALADGPPGGPVVPAYGSDPADG